MWKEGLECDVDKPFLIDGINNGLHISDVMNTDEAKNVTVDNHHSISKYYKSVEKNCNIIYM